MAGKTISDLPQELLIHICQLLYLDAIPKTSFRTLDPHSLPSSYPDGRLTSSPPWHVQATLYSLCLVSKAFYRAARPLLFRRIKITLPHSFLLLLRTLGASHLASAYERFSLTGNVNLDPRDPASFVNMVAAAGFARATGGKLVVSVPGSRTASPYRERGRSRGRELPQSSLLGSPSRPSSNSKGKQKEDPSSQQPLFSSQASQDVSSPLRTQSFRSKLVTDEDGEVELIWQEEELLSETASSESEIDLSEDAVDTEAEDNSEERSNLNSLGATGRRQITRFAVTLSQDAELSAVHRWVRVLDFSTFRTQGLRRTIGEGQVARFVTPARLLALITACSEGLVAFGASETMDSALSREVLEALLFRSGSAAGDVQLGDQASVRDGRRSDSRSRVAENGVKRSRSLRGVSIERKRRHDDSDSDDAQAARVAMGASGSSRKMLQSLDLCNCVSATFVQALASFVDAHLKKFSGRLTNTLDEEDTGEELSNDSDEERRGRGRTARLSETSQNAARAEGSRSLGRSASRTRNLSHQRDRGGSSSRAPSRHPAHETRFLSVLRLGLSGLTVPTDVLNPFVLAFPRLTHLDLSRTKADAALLQALARQPADMLSLQSLSLAHCRQISSESIHELLVESTATWHLTELSLEGSILFPSPLHEFDLTSIIRQAPCFRSGFMRYLDLGGCPVTDETLATDFAPQPSLLDLGLGSNARISLSAVGQFLIEKAPNVQILDLTESCHSLNGLQLAPGQTGTGFSAFDLNKYILAPCTDTPPVPLTIQLALMGFTQSAGGMTKEEAAKYRAPQPLTNLRVVGASEPTLQSVSDGIGSWRVIRGRGRRGWVVDTNAGPDPLAKDEDALVETQRKFEQMQGGALLGRGRRPMTRLPAVRRATSTGHHSVSPARGTHLAPGMSPSRSLSQSRSAQPRRPAVHSPLMEGEDEVDDALPAKEKPLAPRSEVIRDLPEDHPRVKALRALAAAKGHVPGDVGWHPKKMEILLGFGMLGRETGTYAHVAYQI